MFFLIILDYLAIGNRILPLDQFDLLGLRWHIR